MCILKSNIKNSGIKVREGTYLGDEFHLRLKPALESHFFSSKKVLPDINKKILVSGKRIEGVGGVCLIESRPFQETSTFAFSHSEVTVFGLHFLVCMHSSVE